MHSPAPPRPAQAVPSPAPSTSPAPPAASAASAQPAISSNWQGELAAWLEAHKTYPDQARRRGEQGHGSVRFTVDHSGQVLDVAIVSSTGSSILDEAIERMLRGARVPPLPANMDETQVTVTVQIRYALE
jgi:protein TonB